MKLRHNARLIRFAYFGWIEKPLEGDTISLCRLFWQTLYQIAWMSMVWMSMVVVGSSALVYLTDKIALLLFLGIMGLPLLIVLLIVWVGPAVRNISHSPLGELVKGIKNKFCPIITLK